MKSGFDLRHNIGKITPENPDDLFILDSILQEGDFVKAKTLRSIEVSRGGEKEKVGKKTVILKIQLEKKDLSEKLRLTGKIIEGPEDISRGYHSLEVEPGTFLTIERIWKSWEIDKIKAAAKKAEAVLVCILDEAETDIYLIKEKCAHLVHFDIAGSGKGSDKPTLSSFKGILSFLKGREEKFLVVAGPGFAREDLVKEIKETDLKAKIIIEGCSHTGLSGLQEIIKRKVLERVVERSRITQETEAVESLLTEISKEGKAVYGKNETEQAMAQGAVEMLLISEKKVREFESIMEKAEKTNTKVMIISAEHEAGEKLFRLGGIAGLLRYKTY